MTDIQRWGDAHQYHAAPMQANTDDAGNIFPKVYLVSATPDPLGAVAAMCRMYEGKPTYQLEDISDEERWHYLEQVQKTHLKAPLEAVQLHFFIEGVTRSFTHQMVRQRTAVYAQESLRFAVKDNARDDVARPPSIADLPDDDPRHMIWERTVYEMDQGYQQLVNAGIPAEEARGLLPHAITTRLNYVTNLRNLIDHAGNRLCTQAQFEWRLVFMGILKAISEHKGFSAITGDGGDGIRYAEVSQGEVLANSGMFKPVCFQVGKCVFEADFDRSCSIRERVTVFSKAGIPSEDWDKRKVVKGDINGQKGYPPIRPEEWMLNPDAARKHDA